jgi:NitT/TauT family transport system substrate-binding protein
MTWISYSSIAVIFLSLAAVVDLVCAAQSRQVTVAIPGQLAVAAFQVAQEKGYYEQEGLEVQLIQMRDTVANQALIGGNVDFVTAGGGSLTAILAGLPARIVFTGFGRPFWDLYARTDFHQVRELKGKKIGIPGGIGGAPDNYLRQVLRRHGIDGGREAVIIGVGRSSDTYTSLVSGALDAAVLSSVYAVKAGETGFRKLLSFSQEDLNLVAVSGGIAVRNSFLNSDPALIQKFVRGSVKGLIYARNNVKGTVPIWSRRNGIDEAFGAKIYALLVPAMTKDGTITVDAQKSAVEQFSKAVASKEASPTESLFDYSFAKKALADLTARGWKPQ